MAASDSSHSASVFYWTPVGFIHTKQENYLLLNRLADLNYHSRDSYSIRIKSIIYTTGNVSNEERFHV